MIRKTATVEVETPTTLADTASQQVGAGFFSFQPQRNLFPIFYLSILEFVLYHFVDATSRSENDGMGSSRFFPFQPNNTQ